MRINGWLRGLDLPHLEREIAPMRPEYERIHLFSFVCIIGVYCLAANLVLRRALLFDPFVSHPIFFHFAPSH